MSQRAVSIDDPRNACTGPRPVATQHSKMPDRAACASASKPPSRPRGTTALLAILLAATAVTAAVTVAIPAAAHSWYPRECCNENDCFPVLRIERRSDGSMLMTADHFEVVVPPGFPARPSQDIRAHVCVYRNMRGHYLPRCVFLPATS